MWIATKDDRYKKWYYESADALIEHLITVADNNLYTPDINYGIKETTFNHLSCFSGGMFAYGALAERRGNWSLQLHTGVKITETCYNWYRSTKSGLGGESARIYNGLIYPLDETYLLRPETVESIFYMWRITHDQKYRDWGWEIVQSLEKNCRQKVGYAGINANGKPLDKQESFFLAETLKYLYLLFSEDELISLDEYVFNTEAHPLSIRGFGKRGIVLN